MTRIKRRFCCLILLLTAITSLAAQSAQYVGAMVAVTARSIWIKEANGIVRFASLPAQGSISATSLAARYKLGDYVLLKCQTAAPFRIEGEGDWFGLEATSIEYLRPASDPEMTAAIGSAARKNPRNRLRSPISDEAQNVASLPVLAGLDARSLPDGSAINESSEASWSRVRTARRQYFSALPSFMADDVSIHYRSTISNPSNWEPDEKVQSEVSFKGASEFHRNILLNGKPWDLTYEQLVPQSRAGGQNTQARQVIDCGKVEFARRSTEAGTDLIVYRVTLPPDSCFGKLGDSNGARFFPRYAGELWIADGDRLIRRLELKTTGFPRDSMRSPRKIQAEWDYIKIGDGRHVLPTEARRRLVMSNGVITLARRTFMNHRRFDAASSLTYH